MKLETLLWGGVTVYFGVIGVIYLFVSDDPVGVSVLLSATGLGGLVAGWSWDWGRRHGERIEDQRGGRCERCHGHRRGVSDRESAPGRTGRRSDGALVGDPARIVAQHDWPRHRRVTVDAARSRSGHLMIAHTNPVAHGLLVAACAVALALYGAAWLSTPRRSTQRLWSWAGGLLAAAAATAPTVEEWASSSFTGHMVQHLVMIVIAAPLLVLARPASTVLSRWSPAWTHWRHRRTLAVWWRRSGPVLAAAFFLVTLYVTHLTGIYDAALGNQFLHHLEHVAYVVAACGLWSAVAATGRSGSPQRIGAVFGVIGGSALLGVVLLSASTPLIPTYARELGEASALDDQRAAASLMWVGGMAITLPLLIVSVWRWAAAEERIAARVEANEVGQALADPLKRT